MTPRDYKRRLDDQAKFFKWETDFIKNKVRPLFKLAHDAVAEVQRLQARVFELESPKLPLSDGRGLTRPPDVIAPAPPSDKPETRVERIRNFLRFYKDDDPRLARFLKWSRLTLEEARKIVADAERTD